MGYVNDGAGSIGLLDSMFEWVPDLTWPQSVQTYAKMRWDPTLQSILKAYTLPIRRASWALDPAGCRPEVVATVADQLGLPILGQDARPGPARRRGVVWADHLRLALLDLTFGYMAFERTYEIDPATGMASIGTLQERMPQTISDIRVNADGSLAEVRQSLAVLTPGMSPEPRIPAQNLVWYAHDKEGTAWMGQSLLRPAYGSWLLKDETRRVLATSHRRFGMGVPEVTAPPGGTANQTAQANVLASSIRAGDQSGVGLPDGFRLALRGITGSTPDGLGLIRYFDTQMSRATLTGLLDLGDTSNGSRALGDSFLDLFILALQAIADEHAATATRDLVVNLVDINWGEAEPAPRIVCGDVGSSHQVTAQAIQQLMQSGALQSDPALDAFIRGEWKLPARETPWTPPASPAPAAPAGGPQQGPMMASVSARPVQAVMAPAGQFRRQPTEVEMASKADFKAIQSDWETALDRLVADWDSISADQRKQVLAQIDAAVQADDMEGLATVQVDTKAAAEQLAATMHDLADEAADQQAGEAGKQGVKVPTGAPDKERLSSAAVVIAAALASSLVDGSTRKALQAWTPDAKPSDVTGAVSDWMGTLTDAGLRDQLGGGLSIAQGAGRGATLDAAAMAGWGATYYASEILDGSTCDACQEEDGMQFESLDEANAAYGSGGFEDCEGGLRCRGIIVTVWDDAKAA